MNNIKPFKRFLPYLMKHKKVLVLDLFCASLTTICELVLPLIMRYITNQVFADLALFTLNTILRLTMLYLALRVVDFVAQYYMAYVGHVMGARIETDMRKDAYAHLQKLSYTYYNNTKIGQIMGRITNDLFDVTEFAHHCPEEFLIAAIKLSISFVILMQINVQLTLLLFLLVPMMFAASSLFRKKMKRAFTAQRHQIGEMNAAIEDSLLGHKVVKAFANEEIENRKFRVDNEEFLKIKEKTYQYLAGFQMINRVFDALMYILVLLAGGIGVQKGIIGAGDLIAYLLYVTTLISTIRKLIEFTEQFQRGITGIERFYEIVDAPIEIKDSEDAREFVIEKGTIEFREVSFEYPDDHNRIFKNLNLTIRSGEKVAIVGPSGGGKTTLCNLIPRFYDVTGGNILIDGHNIMEFTLHSLRSQIGIVQQDVYLFSGTVYDNIVYGKIDASYDDVIEAARRAGVDEFVQDLKDGYDTYIGERGVKLSGGQKQRISIARVFLKNPSIIILDEATSALDNESEYYVSSALDRLSKGRTTLTIAHRLSSIRNSDRILVLTDNGIEEEGTHEELLSEKGIYHSFYSMVEHN